MHNGSSRRQLAAPHSRRWHLYMPILELALPPSMLHSSSCLVAGLPIQRCARRHTIILLAKARLWPKRVPAGGQASSLHAGLMRWVVALLLASRSLSRSTMSSASGLSSGLGLRQRSIRSQTSCGHCSGSLHTRSLIHSGCASKVTLHWQLAHAGH